ncbi:MAG: diaminopropionate ammonia-lyase [Methylobacterium sp.]|nr:diaminopropionate ammonia-lyase [Methylobacterium sp.]
MSGWLLNPSLDRNRAYGAEEQAILSLEGAKRARETISQWEGYEPTPLRNLAPLAAEGGLAQILYKDEGSRFTLRSFKALGGAYAVQRLVAARGTAQGLTVTSATDGNHGRAVAWGARKAGVKAVIYVHQGVSEGRAEAIRGFGAEVRREGSNYDASVRACAEAAARNGWQIVSDTAWPGYEDVPRDVMQGYAVLAMEAEEAGAKPTHVFVQGGVGGIAAAVLSYRWEKYGASRPRLIVVEPDKAACLYESARAGTWKAVGGDLDTVMAGLACGEPSTLAWKLLQPGADAFMTVTDHEAKAAMRRLAELHVVGGESGVAGLAGLFRAAKDPEMREAFGLDATSRVLLYGTEGATDPQVYRQIVGKTPEEVAK